MNNNTIKPAKAIKAVKSVKVLTPTCQDEVSTAELVKALERCWAAIRAGHVEVPGVVIVVASGSPSRPNQAMKWGHFASLRWQHGQRRVPEVLVSGEGLARPPVQVFATLLHEAAHALADVRGIKDTSRQGRWHNEKFATLARELGLEPTKDPKLGWSPCTLAAATAKTYRVQLRKLETVLRVYRHAEPGSVGTQRASSNNGLSCTCDCDRKIRLSRSVFEQGAIICALCEQPFAADDPDGGAA